MFTVCVGLVFRSKYVQFPIICSLQYSININTVGVDPPLRFTAYRPSAGWVKRYKKFVLSVAYFA